MPWPQTGATHYRAQLGPPDKSRAIKGWLSVEVWLGSMGWVYGQAKGSWSGLLLWSG